MLAIITTLLECRFALRLTNTKLILYSGRPKKNAAGPCVSEAADKDSTLVS